MPQDLPKDYSLDELVEYFRAGLQALEKMQMDAPAEAPAGEMMEEAAVEEMPGGEMVGEMMAEESAPDIGAMLEAEDEPQMPEINLEELTAKAAKNALA